MNLVLCGNDDALKASVSKCFMGENGRQINLVELPALNQLSEEEVMRETLNCVTFCDPGVHAFLLIVPVGPLTNDDKAEIEKIQKIFDLKKHFIVVFTSEITSGKVVTDFITQNPESQSLISQCGDRYRIVLNDPENSKKIPELLDYIENMKTEPYSPEMRLEAQKERARHESEKDNKENRKRMENNLNELQLTGYLVLTVLCLICVLPVFTGLQHIFNKVQGIYPTNSFSDVYTDLMLGKDLYKQFSKNQGMENLMMPSNVTTWQSYMFSFIPDTIYAAAAFILKSQAHLHVLEPFDKLKCMKSKCLQERQRPKCS
ncbi:uncharacterized protein [Garra rufa]|uniref:uncharacterized protein n=1 Tax=Garra rufa TaxID=137080 RepID=UPI003CCE6B35